MQKLNKLLKGDKVAILSPSFAAPGKFPHVFELGLQRIRDIFALEPIEYPTTRKVGATTEERASDLIAAFNDPEIKAVFASIGGDDQVTYIHKMSPEGFINNPKPFFGYSDNSHFCNFLFMHGIPSFYGGGVMTQFAMQKKMDDYTIKYLRHALFDRGESEIIPSLEYNEIGLDWSDESLLSNSRIYEPSIGFVWNDTGVGGEGILWGGCLESIDDMLRNNVPIPSSENFKKIILMTETSEEIPSKDYVYRVYRGLGERGILRNIKGLLVGRPKAWEFDKQLTKEEREAYAQEQQRTIIDIVRSFNTAIPIVQNMNFGHTDPQVAMPYGDMVRIDASRKQIFADFG